MDLSDSSVGSGFVFTRFSMKIDSTAIIILSVIGRSKQTCYCKTRIFLLNIASYLVPNRIDQRVSFLSAMNTRTFIIFVVTVSYSVHVVDISRAPPHELRTARFGAFSYCYFILFSSPRVDLVQRIYNDHNSRNNNNNDNNSSSIKYYCTHACIQGLSVRFISFVYFFRATHDARGSIVAHSEHPRVVGCCKASRPRRGDVKDEQDEDEE